MNNILTHTKQIAFHASNTSGVYAVGYDTFTFSRPRRRPAFWQDEPFTPVPVSETIPENNIPGLVVPITYNLLK